MYTQKFKEKVITDTANMEVSLYIYCQMGSELNDCNLFSVTYFPLLSVGWFIILVLTTSAGVPIVAATSPAHMLFQ
jgi:hypothetical protein